MTPSIQVDEEGYLLKEGRRYQDPEFGRPLLQSLNSDWLSLWGQSGQRKVLVEAFDHPIVATDVSWISASRGRIDAPYGSQFEFDTQSLGLDDWDRFVGVTDQGVSFVVGRTAQMRFFDSLDAFDDSSITVHGRRLHMPFWLEKTQANDQAKWWSQLYHDQSTPWDLGTHHPALPGIHSRIRLNKSRVGILGCGAGHDAAFWAEQGHLVTAVDYSSDALAMAKQRYAHLPNIQWFQADIFELPERGIGPFDLVFEHTCYCAIPPDLRPEYPKLVKSLLSDQGYLLAVFFVNYKRNGPPFGGTEWEIRERFKSRFEFLYWTRWKDYPPGFENRLGAELIVFAQKRDSSS